MAKMIRNDNSLAEGYSVEELTKTPLPIKLGGTGAQGIESSQKNLLIPVIFSGVLPFDPSSAYKGSRWSFESLGNNIIRIGLNLSMVDRPPGKPLGILGFNSSLSNYSIQNLYIQTKEIESSHTFVIATHYQWAYAELKFHGTAPTNLASTDRIFFTVLFQDEKSYKPTFLYRLSDPNTGYLTRSFDYIDKLDTRTPFGTKVNPSSDYVFNYWLDQDGNKVSEDMEFYPPVSGTGDFLPGIYTAVLEPALLITQ